MKKLIKFVECKTTPGLQLWITGSAFYYKCACGQELSYNTPNVKTHWDKYEIWEVEPKAKDFNVWCEWLKTIKEKIVANKGAYYVNDWSQ